MLPSQYVVQLTSALRQSIKGPSPNINRVSLGEMCMDSADSWNMADLNEEFQLINLNGSNKVPGQQSIHNTGHMTRTAFITQIT